MRESARSKSTRRVPGSTGARSFGRPGPEHPLGTEPRTPAEPVPRTGAAPRAPRTDDIRHRGPEHPLGTGSRVPGEAVPRAESLSTRAPAPGARTRVALLGGVYSNDVALRAVLEDVRRAGADLTWCLGDLGGFGPHPDRAAETMRGSGIPVLRGNYDDSIGNALPDCGCGYTDPMDNRFAQISYDYTLANTAAGHREWMRALPQQHRLEIAGRRVLLCHGSPRRVNEFLWQSACSDAFLEGLCEQGGVDVIACAHTGIHWHRPLPSGRHVVNVGAIGRPANDGRTEVWYALLDLGAEVRVEFRPVAYDHEALARDMARESLPQEFIETIRTGWWTTCLENLPAKERRRGRF